MALVLPFTFKRPIHPLGNVSLLASQLRVPGTVPITWNSADKTSGTTLSNSDLTASITGTIGATRANHGGTGKFYFEASVDAVGSTVAIGVADAFSSITTNWLGDSGNANGATMGSDASSHFGGTNGVSFAYTTGDVIGVAVDVPNKLVWWSKNNVWQLSGDPVAGTGGVSISTVSGSVFPIVQGAFSTEIVTGRFTATSLTYTPPSGYSVIDGTAAASNNISGTSSLVLSPTATATGLGTLAGSSALTLTESGTATGLGTLAGSSSLVLAPTGTTTGLAALIGASALTFAPSATATGLGGLIGSSTLVLTPTGTPTGLGTLAGTTPLMLVGSGTITGTGTLAGSSSLALTGSAVLTGLGSLLASTALSLSLSGTIDATTNQIVGSTALAFSGSATASGLGQIAASTSFSLTISGVMVAGAFGEVRVRILDEWQARPVKFWNGSAWVEKPLKYWTGTAWQATSY